MIDYEGYTESRVVLFILNPELLQQVRHSWLPLNAFVFVLFFFSKKVTERAQAVYLCPASASYTSVYPKTNQSGIENFNSLMTTVLNVWTSSLISQWSVKPNSNQKQQDPGIWMPSHLFYLFLMSFVELHTTYSSGHLMYTSGSALFAWDLVCNHDLTLANFFSLPSPHLYIP